MTACRNPRDMVSLRVASAALLAALALATMFASRAAAEDTPQERKIKKQIAVFERIVDQVLVDSPNFLVHGVGDNARGIYLPEVGVVVSFEASLLHKDWDLGNFTIPNFKFETKGDEIIF